MVSICRIIIIVIIIVIIVIIVIIIVIQLMPGCKESIISNSVYGKDQQESQSTVREFAELAHVLSIIDRNLKEIAAKSDTFKAMVWIKYS